ncbi:hypothetical protein ACIHFC_36370 [Streptomyces sp. NPDC052013]|uniref:hypothetical protein n=1 Tax=Streptomyces sp. NPDC052013 TaxID=3365679 RepID=UPI0037D98805
MKIRDGAVTDRPIYLALAVTAEGRREISQPVGRRGIRHVRDVAAAEYITPINKRQFQPMLGRPTQMMTGTLDPDLRVVP